jgi:ribosomal protein S18 acetylase RimI-like enzyme
MLGRVSFVIRRAEPADLSAVGKLAGALVRFHYALNPKRYLLVDGVEAGYVRYFRGELENPRVVLSVAEQDGAIIGYGYGRLEPRDWNALLDEHGALHDILVDPSVRRRGIGKALLQHVLRALEELGAPRVLLSTAVENREAQALFASAGFAPTMLEMTRESGSRK